MKKRMFNFMAWFSAVAVTFLSIYPTTAQAASQPDNFTIEAIPSIVINEFMSNPVAGESAYIELYSNTGATLDSSWKLTSNETQIPLSTLPVTNGHYILVSATLNPNQDTITLTDPSGNVSSISYGNSSSAQLRAPALGKVAGVIAGNWYGNLERTEGTSNQDFGRNLALPAAPTDISIAADPSAQNPTNIINAASTTKTVMYISLGLNSLTSDKVVADVVDSSNHIVTASTDSYPNTTVATAATNLSAINDGQPLVRTFALAQTGIFTSYVSSSATIIKDTSAPTGTLAINGGATVTSSPDVTVTVSARDIGTGINQMRLSNTNNFVGATWKTYANSSSWTLNSADGVQTVYAQFMDNAGNISVANNVLSSTEIAIFLKTTAQNISVNSLVAGTQTVRQLPSEATITANSQAALTLATYSSNPGNNLPNNWVAVGKYVEIGVSDSSKINFPATLKVYITAADLSAAGVSSRSQLVGLAYYDQVAKNWKLFSSTGTSTQDITVNGSSYAGYVYANATHFSPMIAVADISAPSVPQNLTATKGNGQVILSWDSVTDATSYLVKYRPVNSTADFVSVTVTGTTTLTITGLNNETTYNFEVAAQDIQGNTSGFTSIEAKPVAPKVVVAENQTTSNPTTTTQPITTSAPTTTPTPTASNSPSPALSETPSASPSTTSATPSPTDEENDNTSSFDYNKLLITLAILVIAVGAGMAGYYGYQWWATQPEETPTAPKPEEPVKTEPVVEQPQKTETTNEVKPEPETKPEEQPTDTTDKKETKGRW